MGTIGESVSIWIRRLVRLLALIFVGGLSVTSAAEDKAETICDKRFRIFSRDGKTELGTYHIRATESTSNKEIEILESAAIEHRGKLVTHKTSITCDDSPQIAPKQGSAKTTTAGRPDLQGGFTISDGTIDIESTQSLDSRSGMLLDPPKKFAKQGDPLPEGVNIFQSALIALGPRFLPEEGELKDFTWVEFPDGIGLTHFKNGYRLVREKPDTSGEFAMTLYPDESDEEVIAAMRYSKDGELVSIDSLAGMTMVEAKEEK